MLRELGAYWAAVLLAGLLALLLLTAANCDDQGARTEQVDPASSKIACRVLDGRTYCDRQ